MVLPLDDEAILRRTKSSPQNIVERIKVLTPERAIQRVLGKVIKEFLKGIEPQTIDPNDPFR
jgi:hypothetical protein